MLPVPARLHFVGQSLRVESQELRHFRAMLLEKNKLAGFLVMPSARLNAEAERSLAD
jgi:hypothetical protein